MVRFSILLIACVTLSLAVLHAGESSDYRPAAATHSVATWSGDWLDQDRDRKIPVKIYFPDDPVPRRYPVVIFSHGLGGSRDGYSYLGQYWGSRGYVSVHIQHPGSDSTVIADADRPLVKLQKLKKAMQDPANLSNRPKDVSFAIDQLARLQADESFAPHGRLDMSHLAVAGHSFGAYTVLAVAGQAIGPDRSLVYYGPDRRIKAAIAMSSQTAHTSNLDDAYSRIRIPIFHMTGTKDQAPFGERGGDGSEIVGDATVADRRVAFDHTKNALAYLLTFKDGDHMVFSGRGRLSGGLHDQAYQKIICEASTAFWDATLKDDASAQHWLDLGGFAQLLGNSGTFERNHPNTEQHAEAQ